MVFAICITSYPKEEKIMERFHIYLCLQLHYRNAFDLHALKTTKNTQKNGTLMAFQPQRPLIHVKHNMSSFNCQDYMETYS